MILKPVYIECRVSIEFRNKCKSHAEKKGTTLSKLMRKLLKEEVKD